MADDTGFEAVFKALADPTRRRLLDRLRRENGQTLGALGEELGMTRQAVSQHLAVLESAALISSVKRGREKLHYLNPVPLHDITERWIDRFERPRLRELSRVKAEAEEAESTMGSKPTYVYVTYVESTPEKVWEALTSADLTEQYWGHRNESDWREGSTWRHVRPDGSGIADVEGTVVEADAPRKLVCTWAGEPEPSRVTFDLEPFEGIVRLTVTHENLPTEHDAELVGQGWPAVFANLKSLLETGRVMSTAPWSTYAAG